MTVLMKVRSASKGSSIFGMMTYHQSATAPDGAKGCAHILFCPLPDQPGHIERKKSQGSQVDLLFDLAIACENLDFTNADLSS